MSGPTIEEALTWLIRNADRNPSAEVVVMVDGSPRHYRVRVWRDGTVALRPKT